MSPVHSREDELDRAIDYGSVARIDPTTGRTMSVESDIVPASLAVGLGAVWVAAGDGILKLNSLTGSISATITFHRAHDIAAAYGAIWAVSRRATESRLDPRTGRVTAAIGLSGTAVLLDGVFDGASGNHLAAGAGAVWVNHKKAVIRVSPETNLPVAFIPVDFWRPRGIAFAAGKLWVFREAGRLSVIDPETNRALSLSQLTGVEDVIAAGEDVVWIVRRARGWSGTFRLVELDPATYRARRELPVTDWRPSDTEPAQQRAVWLCLGGRLRGILLPT